MESRAEVIGPEADALRVLVVDGASSTRLLVARTLASHGFVVDAVADVDEARRRVADGAPDVIVLDVEHRDSGGLDLLREVLGWSSTPVILLTAPDADEDRVRGLEQGAADSVVKPFYPRELAVRVRRVAARRPGGPAHAKAGSGRMDFGRLVIDTVTREVTLDGRLIELTNLEFNLLAHLAATPRKAFSRDELLADVWPSSPDRQDRRTVTEHIRRLRLKLEDDAREPRWLITVRVGAYRFEP